MVRLVPLFLLCGCGLFFPLEPGPDPVVDDGGVVLAPEDAGTTVRGFDKATCSFNGKKLYGRVQYVTSFPDVEVKVVTALPDLRVKKVSSLANSCGEWEEVTSLPDLKVKIVTALPDLEIEYVTAFPGLP